MELTIKVAALPVIPSSDANSYVFKKCTVEKKNYIQASSVNDQNSACALFQITILENFFKIFPDFRAH